ncbi:hypothetical protein O0L34_g12862 [Tuta absoluta]|nr:hypothetical protein O0L34_g12862 [Tuta absoluta]
MATLDEWEKRYTAGETASVTKLFFPSATMAYKIVRKFEATSTKTQILTGHGGFSEYLNRFNRFKCKENSSCICDPGVEETVPHILLDCPVNTIDRYNLEHDFGIKLDKNSLSELMAGKNRQTFLRYCVKVSEAVIKRNKTA